MELEQLRHFLLVAEQANFTRAAELAFLSQSALSRSIARLEEELGRPLFERRTRRVTLTDAGNLFLSRARQITALAEDAKEEMIDDGTTGRVRIAAIPTVAPYYLPERLREFQSHHPQARLIVHEETTERLIKRVLEGDIDVAIAALPIDQKYLQVETLFEEELLLVMAAEHPLAAKRSIRIEDIESLPFILLGEAHCLTDNVVSFCQQKAFHPVSVETTSQLVMVQELVALNHGISLVPAMARNLDSSPKRIYRPLSGTKPSRHIVMITNPYRYQSKLQKKFEESLIQQSKPKETAQIV
jgi:LysR family transcriptional regulator, hydrogen peroxide-inducible genes activator